MSVSQSGFTHVRSWGLLVSPTVLRRDIHTGETFSLEFSEASGSGCAVFQSIAALW